MLFEKLTGEVIDAAMKVHSALGAGLFEQVYNLCLRHELRKRGIKVLHEVEIPILYDGLEIAIGYRMDLLVEDNLIVERKSVEHLAPAHKAQLLTYLKLTKLQVGLLLNFNVAHLKDGIIRVVNTILPPRTPRPPR